MEHDATPSADSGTEIELEVRSAYGPLYTSRDLFVGVEGPRGTAKTTSDLCALMQRALQYPGSRILLLRQDRTDLTETVLVTLEEQVFPMFGLSVPGGQNRENRSEYELPSGSTLVPVGVGDGKRFLSSEYTFALVNQAEELEEGVVRDLAGCLRYTRSAKRPTLPDYAQAILEPNPEDPEHWLNKKLEPVDDSMRRIEREEDGTIYVSREGYDRIQRHNWAPCIDPDRYWKRIITKHADNIGYWDFDRWDWTPQGKRYVTQNLAGLPDWKRKRWLFGLWTGAEGGVFPEFSRETHVIPDFEPPKDWPIIFCYDPGFGMTAGLWICRAPDGGLIAFDEIYEGGKSIEEHCAEINRRNKEHGRVVQRYFGDPNEMFSNRAQGVSCAQQAKAYGLRFSPWPREAGSAFDAGVEAIRHVLGNTAKKPESPPSPYLRVCQRCRGLVSNFESWRFVKAKSGTGIVGADRYEAGNDHALDCLRGGISSGFLQRIRAGAW